MNEMLLKVKNVCKTYKGTDALFKLKPISFDIKKGEIVSVLGLNGAGKSTLMKIILSIITADSGEIKFFNDPANENVRQISYLPENFSTNNLSLTVFEFISIMAELNGCVGNAKAQIISEIIGRVGLENYLNKKTNNLSKGMLTRLGLSQALLGDPSLIVLDEPTEGLDPEWRLKTKTFLLELRQKGKSILISSHLLYELEQISDRILILHKGECLYFGKLDISSIIEYYKIQNHDQLVNDFRSNYSELTLERIFFLIIRYFDNNYDHKI